MRKIILIFILVGSCVSSFAQITVISETDNTTLIGSLILPSNGPVFIKKPPPVRDGFQALGDKDKNKYAQLRDEANGVYANLGFTNYNYFASLVYFKNSNDYLLTFTNSLYNYQQESFWITEQTKIELYNYIQTLLSSKTDFKSTEITLSNNVVLVLTMNRKKVRFALHDGYKWYASSWFRLSKINKLFGQ